MIYLVEALLVAGITVVLIQALAFLLSLSLSDPIVLPLFILWGLTTYMFIDGVFNPLVK